jgi:nucleotide-binding universal stress UspA family protein
MSDDPIFVATDLSVQAGASARWAHRLGERLERPVVPLYVVELSLTNWYEGQYEVRDDPDKREETARRVEKWYQREVDESPDDVEVRVGTPHRQITEVVKSYDDPMVALSVSGKSAIGQLAFGSTSLELARKPPCPVAIVHPDYSHPGTDGEIMVGTDLGPSSEAAVAFAVELAQRLKRGLHVVHSSRPVDDLFEDEPLVEPPQDQALAEDRGELLKHTLDTHAESLREVTVHSKILDARPSRGLCQYLEDHESIDIAIFSDRIHGGSRAALLSSVALRCVQLQQATVIVVPHES